MAYTQPYYWASLLLGILLPIFMYSNNKLQDKNRRHRLLYFSGNLCFITANLSITLSILVITGGSIMSPNDIAMFASWAKLMTVASIIILGLVFGLALTDGIESGRTRKKQRQDKEIESIAYHLWEDNGKQNGHSMEYWLKAEIIWKELRKKRK